LFWVRKGGKRVTKKEVASLACKILALYSIINGLAGGIFDEISIIQLGSNRTLQRIEILTFLAPFLVGIALWFFSETIATKMLLSNEKINKNNSPTAMEIQVIAFSILGLFFIGNALPKTVSTVYILFTMEGFEIDTPSYTQQLIEVGIQLVIGLGLFLGTQRLILINKAIKSRTKSRN
jgi:hypothetical protein